MLEAARGDPSGFVRGLDQAIVDEVQRAPDLLRAIKMQVVNLLPLSRAEIGEKKPTFLQKAMAGRVAKTTEYLIGDDLVDAVFTGGYPEMIQRRDRQRRRAWARG